MSLEMLAPYLSTWQVSEGRQFYIPDYLRGDRGKSRPDLYAAADDHAQHLRDAQRYLDDALNLAGTLRAALEDAGDSRAMQVDTVLKIIEDLLDRVHSAIDSHDTRFMNLFMAYFDLEDRTPPSTED